MKNNSQYYKTDSFYFSAFLLAEGFSLDCVEKSPINSNKLIFVFPHSKDLQKLKTLYFSYQATVKPQDYSNAMSALRSIIYEQKSR